MKRIAITQRIIEAQGYAETRDALDMNWSKLFEQAGLIPIIVPTYFSEDVFLSIIKPDGLILSGGNDLSQFSDDKNSTVRDQHEKKLLDLCVAKNIPIIGICRGMQLIAQHFGGKLKPVTSHIGNHTIISAENSRLKNFKLISEVNSYHNYGVEVVPPNFTPLAYSQDKTVEAMEHNSLAIYGQMWHPERNHPFLESDINFIKTFFNA